MGSFSGLNSREDFLSFNTCISGLPPSTWGFRSWMGFNSSAKLKMGQVKIKKNSKQVTINGLFFMKLSPYLQY